MPVVHSRSQTSRIRLSHGPFLIPNRNRRLGRLHALARPRPADGYSIGPAGRGPAPIYPTRNDAERQETHVRSYHGYRRDRDPQGRCHAELSGARRPGHLRPVRVPRGCPARLPGQAHLQETAPDDRRSRTIRPGHRGCCGARREGVGDGAWRHPLHPLVRAHDRLHRGEARLVPQPHGRGPDDRGVLRQEPGAGRAGRQLVPVRWHPGDLRGARLHRLGRDQPDLPPGRAQWRHHDDPDGVCLLHGRGPRSQDPAAALAGSPGQAGAAHPALVRQHHGHPRVHQHRSGAGVLPGRWPPRRAAAGLSS